MLDELDGEIYFTKLDLHLGYRHIRMKKEDIPKIEFRTHEGHYQLLVMLLFLTNAPSKLQGLMDSIFKPSLKKIGLVFFDDMIIYRNSWEEHVQHVYRVIQILKEKKMYSKPSKHLFRVK